MVTKPIKGACVKCNVRQLCLPVGLSSQELGCIDDLITIRRRVKRNASLFHNGEKFINLYAIRSGFFKTSAFSVDSLECVTGFPMAGEILGFDGIVNNRHICDAVALEDAEVCVLPLDLLEELSLKIKPLHRHILKIMSREIVWEHQMMLILGSMRSEERLAAFLLNLINRLDAGGFSNSELILRMTRKEIGSYLGLTLETVSRTFSRLAIERIVEVRQRRIHILDADALEQIVNHSVRL
jgi:CRP/FNR family transcriptional regulator